MKKHVLNRIIVMMLVICMLFSGLIPGTTYEAVAMNSTMNLQATVRVERIGKTDIAPTTVEFTQGETAYDVLEKVATITGTDMITKINGYPDASLKNVYWMFRVNGKMPMLDEINGANANQYVVKSGDYIEFYAIYYSDVVGAYSYFESKEYEVPVNTPLQVKLLKDEASMGDFTSSIKPVNGAKLLKSNINENKATIETEVYTNNQGIAEIHFNEVGSYVLSASFKSLNGKEQISRPYTIVKVTTGGAIDADIEIVNSDKNALTIENTSDNIVATDKLVLSKRGVSGQTIIEWSSSNESIISSTGIVKRPTYPSTNNINVTLTATIKKGTTSVNKDFNLQVKPYTLEETTSDLQSVVNSLSAIKPVYGVDSNVVTMVNSVLSKKGRSDISVEYISAQNAGTEASSAVVYVGQNGNIDNWYDNTSNTTIRVAQVDVKFKFILNTVEQEKILRAVIPLDNAKIISFMTLQDVNLLTDESIKDQNTDLQNVKTQLNLPSEIGGKKSWITWESDSNLVKIDGNSLNGYTGKVTIPSVDTNVNLKATFTYRYSDIAITAEKTFPIVIKAPSGDEAEQIKTELNTILENNFTIDKFGEYVAIKDPCISLQEDYKNNNVRYNFKVPDIRRQLPEGVTYTQESSDPSLFSFETFSSGFVNYVARVVRPNVGESAKTANVTITMTKNGVSVKKVIPFTIAPLTQEEINAEIALMDKVKANIWEGINNGNNFDKDNIVTDLKDIYCVYEKDGQLVWGYDYKSQIGVGLKPDDLFPNPDDPYDTDDTYKFEPSGYFSDVTMKLAKRPDKDTRLSFKTCLTSQLLGKYAEIYPENQDLKKLYRNEVTLELTVKAINPKLKNILIEGVNLAFDSNISTYYVLTDNILTAAKITVQPENSGATITINDEKVKPNHQHSIALVEGSSNVIIKSVDSTQTQTYSIIIVSKKFLEDEIAKLPSITSSDDIIFDQKANVEKLLAQYNLLDDINKAKISNASTLIAFNVKLQEVIENNQNLTLQKELEDYINANYTDSKAILNYEGSAVLDFNNIVAPKIKLKTETSSSKYSYKWTRTDDKTIDIYNTSGYAYVNRDEAVDKTVTVTVTLTNKSNKDVFKSKDFVLTVKKFTDEEKSNALNLVNEVLTKTDIQYADGEDLNSVKSDIKLIKNKPSDISKQYDYNYIWTSSDDTVAKVSNVSDKITIVRPSTSEQAKVITITLDVNHKQIKSATAQKTFTFTVLPVSNEDILKEKANMETVKDKLFDGIKDANTSIDAVTKNLIKASYAKVNSDGTIRWNTTTSKKADDNVEIEWVSSSDSSFIDVSGYSAFKLSKRPNQGENDKVVVLKAKVKSLVFPALVEVIPVELSLTVKAYNAYLSNLKLSETQISFSKNTLEYEFIADSILDKITVTPTLENIGADLSVGGSKLSSGTPKDIALTNGCGTIEIKVEDGKEYSWSTPKASNTYKVTVVSKKYLEDEIKLLPTTDEEILINEQKIKKLNEIYNSLTEEGKAKIVDGIKIAEIYEKLEKILKDNEEKQIKEKLNAHINTNYVTNNKFITLGTGNIDKDSIVDNFKLKKEGYSSSYTSTWSSESELLKFTINSSDVGATVSRPSFEDGDKKVIVTLTLKDNKTSIFVTKDFEITIKALDQASSDSIKVELQSALDACYIENKDGTAFDAQNVKMPFKLKGKNSSYNWTFTSTDETIVKPSLYEYSESIVSRPMFENGNKEVTITLSVSKAGSNITLAKVFKLNVIALTKEETETVNSDFEKAIKECTIADAAGGSFDINNIKNKKLKLNLPTDKTVKGNWEVDTGMNISGGDAFKIATVIRPSIGQEDKKVVLKLTLTHVGTGKILVKTFNVIIKAETEEDRANELENLKRASVKLGEFVKSSNNSLDEVMTDLKKPDSVSYLADGSFMFSENGYHMHAKINFNGLYTGDAYKYLNSNLSLKKRPDFGSEDVKINITAVLESNNYGSPYIKYEYPIELTIKAYSNLLDSIKVDGVNINVPADKDTIETKIIDTKKEIKLSALLKDPLATMKIDGKVVDNKEELNISVVDKESIQIITDINGNEKAYTIKLVKVKPEDVTVEWPLFRGEADNMAIVDYSTPRISAEASLKWSNKLTNSWTENSSNIIIAEDFVWVVIKNELAKYDKEGNLMQKAALSSNAEYNTHIAYGDRTIFVALYNGVVEAVDTTNMSTKWISEKVADEHSVFTPILYNNGYIYAGTSEGWDSTSGYYFCINAEDGSLVWKNKSDGKGYYWAGATAIENTVVYGNDDGLLLSVNSLTGEKIDSYQADGAIRSCVSTINGTLYFTTKNGKLYSIKINSDGFFDDESVKSNIIAKNVTGSTSTPLVYNNRVYVGAVNGEYKGVIGVLDASSLQPIYSAELPANVQSSGLLTTAYSGIDNKNVYVYFTYNKNPGGIVVLEDFEGNTTPIVSELYVPVKEQQNYCISSIIADSNGTLYYKNDSGYMFAIEKKDSKGSPVNFIVEPKDAVVVLENSDNDKISEITKNTFDLGAGTYKYIVSKEGYKDSTGSITISIDDSNLHIIKNIFVALEKESTDKPTTVEEITVTFKLIGDSKHGAGGQCSKEVWVPLKTYKVPKNSTVKYLTDKILTENGIPFITKDNGTYITSINGLAEFDNGKNSGWMYTVNGTHENVDGYAIQILNDGDAIVWHYTDEYTEEEGMGSWNGNSSSETTVSDAKLENNVANVTVSTVAKLDSNGKAVVEVDKDNILKAIESVVSVSKSTEINTTKQITIEVNVEGTAKEVHTNLSVDSLKEIVVNKIDEIKIKTSLTDISLDQKTISSILKQSKGNEVSLSISSVDNKLLTETAKAIISDRPIFDFNIVSGNKNIKDFNSGSVTLTIPYTLSDKENADKLVIYYIKEDGTIQTIRECEYDFKEKAVKFVVQHFSQYAVGYEQFTDLRNHWAEEAINYVYAKKLFNGTTEHEFSPNKSMTRGMFVTVLGRLSGADTINTSTGFKDVSQEDYYAPYIKWAVDNNLVKGKGNNIFAPNQAITREEMAVILANYMKMLGKEISVQSIGFKDEKSISTWAKESVKVVQSLGLIQGKEDNNFDPKATSTRAEVAIIIQRLLSK